MHTPGPWRVDGDIKTMTHGCTSRPIACDDHQVAYVFVDSGKFEGDVGDANARLIAAAPDLYEALKDLIGACAHWGDDEFKDRVQLDLPGHKVLAARAALSKVSQQQGSPQALSTLSTETGEKANG